MKSKEKTRLGPSFSSQGLRQLLLHLRRGLSVGALESLTFEPLLAGRLAPVLGIETPKMAALALASPRKADGTNMGVRAYNVQEAHMRATPIGRNGYEAR